MQAIVGIAVIIATTFCTFILYCCFCGGEQGRLGEGSSRRRGDRRLSHDSRDDELLDNSNTHPLVKNRSEPLVGSGEKSGRITRKKSSSDNY